MKLDKRLIGHHQGSNNGPVLIFFGGIHGNEPAGVRALEQVMGTINKNLLKGSVYAIKGNLPALERKKRYLDEDLNRIWTEDNINTIQSKTDLTNEEKELMELLELINSILTNHKGPIYFFDLHTTSSKTIPFITINDAIINRSFSKLFPVPIVLGIEEYLEGPLLSYINQKGYVSLGFESGQHNDKMAIKNAISFIHLALVHSGCVKMEDVKDYYHHFNSLKAQSKSVSSFFEIVSLYKISGKDRFKMCSGFESFQKLKKGTRVAVNNNEPITVRSKGRIFMPLYQKKGSEGFFIIRPVETIFLGLSKALRRIKIDGLLICLPGVKWFNKEKGILSVNLKVARYLAKPLFHLLGYRSKQITKTHLYFFNRERVAKTVMYKDVFWY